MHTLYRRMAAATLFAGMAGCTPLPGAQPMVEESHVSSHELRFVHVNGARLQLVDWGGEGPLLLFLPGFGNSAHVFDDLAPEFTDQYHVVGLTPRGFPPSSAPDSGYTIAQLANDVLAVVDSLHTQRVIVVGHSISGAVITELGVRHTGRLAAGIYLDASFDFGPALRRSRQLGGLTPSGTASAEHHAWSHRYSDSLLPRRILDAMSTEQRIQDVDPSERARRGRLVSALADEVRSRPHEPWRVNAPLLAICAVGSIDRRFGWLTPDSPRWEEARRIAEEAIAEEQAECARLGQRAPHAQVLEIDASHYVFVDAREPTVRAMRSFLATLQPPR